MNQPNPNNCTPKSGGLCGQSIANGQVAALNTQKAAALTATRESQAR